jgi:hypothetical protein
VRSVRELWDLPNAAAAISWSRKKPLAMSSDGRADIRDFVSDCARDTDRSGEA